MYKRIVRTMSFRLLLRPCFFAIASPSRRAVHSARGRRESVRIGAWLPKQCETPPRTDHVLLVLGAGRPRSELRLTQSMASIAPSPALADASTRCLLCPLAPSLSDAVSDVDAEESVCTKPPLRPVLSGCVPFLAVFGPRHHLGCREAQVCIWLGPTPSLTFED